LIGKEGRVTGAEVVEVVWEKIDGRFQMKEIPGTEELIEADLVLLSMGFVSPVHDGLLDGLGVEYDERGNVKAVSNTTSIDKVFAAGDVARGASLVVHAIRSGRDAAEKIHEYLMQD
jgi:glutamate synthase (NADPH/NADH) small chain